MTKQELSKKVKAETGVDERTVGLVLESAIEQIQQALLRKECVTLRGFGSFELKRRAEKVARNIGAGTAIVLPAHYIPYFKPCDELKKKVSGL